MLAEGVSFCYGCRIVIDRLSFALRAGEMVGIVGPNGAGKSTLIKGLSGVLPPSRGRILVRRPGASVAKEMGQVKRPELARTLAVVPQQANLPESFTAGEVVLMGRTPHLGLLQAEGPRDWGAVWRAMALTDTVHLAERRIGELSGGERQRVVIARALAQEAPVLLLDEPTTHLDLCHQLALLDLVQRLRHECGLAVGAVFHDLNLAAQYCDRLVMLMEGRSYAEGTPAEVITSANVSRVYGARVCILPHPSNGLPMTVVAPGRAAGEGRWGTGDVRTAEGAEVIR